MAIYYIDPHTTTNGTGTWASPWSFSSSNRTGLADGDEIRIKGVALTSLLTATSYTATVTDKYIITITAGGGLGADFAAGDVVYIPSLDVFFRVTSVSVNVIQGTIGSAAFLPLTSTTQIGTSITVRRVDTATYGVSTTGSLYEMIGNIAKNNITISDCWTGATTRVTDGTVKTLLNTSASSAITLNLDSASTSSQCSNVTANLQNTHVMGTVTTNSRLYTRINGKNSTYNINQLWQGANATYGLYYGSGATLPVTNITINIKHMVNMTLSAITSYANTITCTIDTFVLSVFDTPFGTSNWQTGIYNYTINFGNFIGGGLSYGSFVRGSGFKNTIINYNGVVDLTTSVIPPFQYALSANPSPVGNITLNFGSSFALYYNNRANTLTSRTLTAYFQEAVAYTTSNFYYSDMNLPSGWVCSTILNIATTAVSSTNYNNTANPNILTFNFATTKTNIFDYFFANGTNFLCTYRDGSSPVEYIGPFGNGYNSVITGSGYVPAVTTDASVYNTTSPSLKSNLVTRSSSIYPSPICKSRKPIKIPVTSGTSYTVTGYIRCDDTAYVNGDCKVSVFFNETVLDSQDMTTSCVNAWEQFTLTFTATQTGEALFAWDMYYANGGKSYWLSDLTIS